MTKPAQSEKAGLSVGLTLLAIFLIAVIAVAIRRRHRIRQNLCIPLVRYDDLNAEDEV